MMDSRDPSRSAQHLSLPGSLALLVLLRYTVLGEGEFAVIGHGDPILAMVGEEVEFPCHLLPELDAGAMEVRWFRDRFTDIVHTYYDRQDQFDMQMRAYRGRTEFLKDGLQDGSATLRLHGVIPADEGQYGCLILSETFSSHATWELEVAGLGSDPHISFEGYQDGGIQLRCSSGGWYPEPKAQWKDPQGQCLPSLSETKFQDSQGLYHLEMSLVTRERYHRNVSCSIQNPLLVQKKEFTLQIADVFLPQVSPWRGVFPGILGCLLLLFAPLAGLVLYYFRKQKKSRDKLKNKTEKEKEKLTVKLEKLQTELEWRRTEGQAEWRAACRYAVDVTLDQDTAHPMLQVSEDRKSVTYGDTKADLPGDPKRFENCPCVLGQEGFISGRHYWEVEVGQKTRWFLGVCQDAVERKVEVRMSPGTGYWVLGLWNSAEYFILDPYRVSVTLRVPPRRVGVFLDYEGGRVSFFNVTDGTHIYTFTATFSGTLRPYLRPRSHDGGEHAAPLTVCPVPGRPEAVDDCDTWLQPYDTPDTILGQW
ncbi:butyrophilin-like protein 9 [Ornithorhynchus anatinus]|uniref:Butyrophilin like 9 n=1 Tax=Ornithorhynchus anatinus TaxID=9258 RepID=F7DI50_ORNAN|nr:butyrophilin-like protein 9 [Ornithorhynchus anatinus]